MKIAFVGSRDFPDEQLVRHVVQLQSKDTVIVSGGARGVDSWAVDEAKACGMETLVFNADWDTHDKAAGMIRNAEIVNAADKVIAFWDGKSKGTKNTIDRAAKAGKPCEVVFDTTGVNQLSQDVKA